MTQLFVLSLFISMSQAESEEESNYDSNDVHVHDETEQSAIATGHSTAADHWSLACPFVH